MSGAGTIHAEICGLLLGSLESLQHVHVQFVDLLHLPAANNAKAKLTNCPTRLARMSEIVKGKKSEDD